MAVDTLSPSPAAPLLAAAAPTAAAPTTPTPSARRLSASSATAAAAPGTHALSPSPDGATNGIPLSSYRFRSPIIRRVSPIRVTPLLPANRLSPRSPRSPRSPLTATSSDTSRSSPRTPLQAVASDTPKAAPRTSLPAKASDHAGAATRTAFQVADSTAASAEDRLASSRLVQLASSAGRSSQHDESGAESDLSQSVDRLTALAKETLARVDRITSESSATLRQPVAKNVVIVSKSDQEASTSTSSSNGPRSSGHNGLKPISILKRKSSHEEGSVTPPVTFSPSVVEQTLRRQGILKKSGGSFDESHLRRSCSPETEASGSILKNRSHRRSSLEENSNGIHGILKKKSPIESAGKQTHMSIADHVIMAANGDLALPHDDDVRPILKKRCSTDEQSIVDPSTSSSETPPRPILKKKSSTETDEMDEWPKKTILKTSRKNSREEGFEVSESIRRRSVGSAPLNKSSGPRLSFCDDEDQGSDTEESMRRRIRASRSFTSVRPTSPSGSHSDFSSVEWRRRSWDHNSSPAPILESPGRTPSVAERVSSMEFAFHSNGALPKQPRIRPYRANTQPITAEEIFSSNNCVSNRSGPSQGQSFGSSSAPRSPPPPPSLSPPRSPPPSPPRSPSPSPPASPLPSVSPPLSPCQSPSLVRPSSLVLSPGTGLTSGETSFGFRNHVSSPVTRKDSWGLSRNGSIPNASSSYEGPEELGDNWILKNRSSPVPQFASWITSGPVTSFVENHESWDPDINNESGLGESCGSDFKASFERSFVSLSLPYEPTCNELKDSTFSDDDDEIQEESKCFDLSVEETKPVFAKMELEDGKQGLQRSSSRVSEKALLFSQMEEKMKQCAEEARAKRIPKADLNKGIARYRNRKSDKAGEPSRFSTQPITVNELKGIKTGTEVTSSASVKDLSKAGGKNDLNTIRSIADRVKVFDSISIPNHKDKGNPKKSPKRKPHFATQPVTSYDVLAAKNMLADSRRSYIEGSEDENDPSKLSLAERVKLFNQAMTAERLPVMGAPAQPQNNRRRAPNSRFKTQPVTIEEVSTAQNIIKQPSHELIANGSTKAVREIFESSSKDLSKSTSCSSMSTDITEDSPNTSTKRGILRNTTPVNETFNSIIAHSNVDDESRVAEIKRMSDQDNLEPGSRTSIVLDDAKSGLDHIKKVLSNEKTTLPSPSKRTHMLSNSTKRRASFETASHSSSESDSETSSDSDVETKEKHIPQQKVISKESEARVMREHQEKHPPSAPLNILRRAMQPENDEKVRNTRNTSQEKENREIEQILDNKNKFLEEQRGTKLKSDETKKLVLKKLEVLNKNTNVSVSKKTSRDTEIPNCSSAILTSDDGDTSSGGQEVRKIISNDAVARRHQANLARQQLNREKDKQQMEKERPRPGRLDAGLTQRLGQQLQLRLPGQAPPLSKSRSQHAALPQQDSDEEDADDAMAVHSGAVAGGLRRCLTQPMPPPVADNDVDVSLSVKTSIADRLKLLQQNGETGWRKRVVKPAHEDVAKSVSDSQQVLKHLISGNRNSVASEPTQELISLQRSGSTDRSSILADRLGKLENASQDWRKRVGQKDAEQFSVKGKMKMSSSTTDVPRSLATPPLTPDTPLTPPELAPGQERGKKIPKPRSFRSKSGISTHVFKRSMSAPGAEEDADSSPNEHETSETNGSSHTKIETQVQGPRIELPRIDDQFESFFSTAGKISSNQSLEMKDVDLDLAVTRSTELLVQKRTVKVSARRVASRNPVKALSARTDLCTDYVELRTGVAEREMKRLRAEKLAKNSSLAVEALAGLASKEDFSAVSLRKSASTSAMPSGTTLLPYKEIMLLQIKGRRHIQTRLVEPTARSINSGDNFVLVTPSQVYNWVGRYSNVIERARGAEIAAHVQQNKDLGFRGEAPVVTINEERTTCTASQSAAFWRLLGSLDGPKVQNAGHPDEDELYETAILETNMIYELNGSELVPFEKYWGSIPRIEMLDPSKILVFDFGSEMYVWNGKNAALELRKVALQLAKELWDHGYDYTDCDVCPLLGATSLGPQFGRLEESGTKSGKKRPLWALIAKVTQHMETILFREKFLDWPDFTRVIQAKEDPNKDKVVDASVDVRPCSAKEMFESEPEDPDLLLEGSHLGRGSEYYDEETRRFYEIQTTGVKVWHIQEYDYTELPVGSYGQFHSADNYVVRWAYRVTVTTRALNGQPSKHAASQGRDRFCYFCWQGRNALVNDKGAAALLTVELDKERGPQICVTQGLEPPAFLGLFEGRMNIHSGRREDRNNHKGMCRLYAVKGEVEREACLIEVTPSMRQLRSRGSFLLLNEKKQLLHIWHGARSLPHNRKVAEFIAQKMQKSLPEEFCFSPDVKLKIQNEDEGSESQEFFKGVGGSNRHLYVSLREGDAKESFSQYSPRLFHLTSLSGIFTATEVAAPCRNSKLTLPFPFQQNHLYGASQPAIFLLDNGDSLWLWQGWWPSERDEEDSNVVAGGEGLGSGAVRWQAERRAAMQTALDYWSLQHPGKTPLASLVWAGLEPLEFTNLFLEWTDRDDIAEINIQDGHKAGELLSVQDELARLTQSTYPPAQLLQRPLPDGVDPTRLELYLAPQHFQEILGMSKEEFLDLPQWKQTKLKKDAGLF